MRRCNNERRIEGGGRNVRLKMIDCEKGERQRLTDRYRDRETVTQL